MTIPLLVLAASGLAKEIVQAVGVGTEYEVVGMLDDNASLHGTRVESVPVLGGLEQVVAHPDAALVLAAGRGTSRAAIADRLDALGVAPQRYARVIHPRACISASSTVGPGSVLLAGVVLTASVTVGRHVVVMPNAVLTHDDVVDDFATICAAVALAGNVRVGRAAYLGAGSLVRERLTVGEQAILGMGAVAVDDVPAGQTWVGNPARPLPTTTRSHAHQPDAAQPRPARTSVGAATP